MFSQPCRLLFLAVLLAAGLFNTSSAQNTVPYETVYIDGCKAPDWNTLVEVSDLNQCAQLAIDFYVGNGSCSGAYSCTFEGFVKGSGSNYTDYGLKRTDNNFNPPIVDESFGKFRYYPDYSTTQGCPSSHPVDNGDGTCSTDTAHEDWCQAVANGEWGDGGTEYHTDSSHPLYGSVALCVTYDHNPWVSDGFFNDDGGAGTGYSCVYEVDFHAETAGETWYRATSQTCTRINDDNCPEGQRNCAATHVPGSDDGGGSGDGGTDPIDGSDLTPPNNPTEPTPPDPASSPEAENLTYVGEKFAFETRRQTDQLIEGLAQSVNQQNANRDKNTDRVLKGLAAVQKQVSEIPGGGGGSSTGDPAGWGNEEDISIDPLDCTPDPITGACTNWTPLTQQELPERIVNLDNEISQFDEYSVTASCPDSLDMGLSFGVFDYNSKPVCDTLGGVRYILLALAYFIVARIVMRSMG